MEDDSMAAMIASWKDNVIEFMTAKLEKYQPRDNYRDLLIYIPGCRSCMQNLLSISWSHSPCSLDDQGHIFHWDLAVSQPVGTTPAWIIRITEVPRSRSITHQYCRPKIWSLMKEAALFVTAIYTKYRFESPVSTAAPRNDLVHITEKGSYNGSHHGIQSTFVVFVRTVGRIRVI